MQQILIEEKVDTNNFKGVYYHNMVAGYVKKDNNLRKTV